MAGPAGGNIKVGTPVGKASDAARIALEARSQKSSEILNHLGIQDPEQLPNTARAALETLLENNRLDLEALDARQAAAQIQRAFARDAGLSAMNSAAALTPTSSVKINGAATQIDPKHGTMALRGALQGKDHPVRQLMEQLQIPTGIAPSGGFGPGVKKVLDGLQGKDLGSEHEFRNLARSLGEAHVLDTKPSKLGGLTALSHKPIESAAILSSGGKITGLKLESTARTQEQLNLGRGENNPEAVRNLQNKNTTLESRRAETTLKLRDLFVGAGLPEHQASSFAQTVDKLLARGSSEKDPANHAFQIARHAEQMSRDDGKLAPNLKLEAGHDSAHEASLAAAFGISAMAQKKFGVTMSPESLSQAHGMIADYVGAAPARPARGGGPVKPLSGKMAPKELSAEAGRLLDKMGIDEAHPSRGDAMKRVETALRRVTQEPFAHEGELALRALKWTKTQSKDPNDRMLEHIQTILSGVPDLNDPTLSKEGKEAAQSRYRMAKEFAFKHLAMAAVADGDPNLYRQLRGPAAGATMAGAAGMAGLAGVGGNGGGMPPGMMPGGMMPGAGGWNGGGWPPAFNGMLPNGMTVPGNGPLDMNHRMQGAFIAAQGSAILHDPSLSHEDKTALFVMLLMTWQDRQREALMREMADMDAADARKSPNNPMGGGNMLPGLGGRIGQALKTGASTAAQAVGNAAKSGVAQRLTKGVGGAVAGRAINNLGKAPAFSNAVQEAKKHGLLSEDVLKDLSHPDIAKGQYGDKAQAHLAAVMEKIAPELHQKRELKGDAAKLSPEAEAGLQLIRAAGPKAGEAHQVAELFSSKASNAEVEKRLTAGIPGANPANPANPNDPNAMGQNGVPPGAQNAGPPGMRSREMILADLKRVDMLRDMLVQIEEAVSRQSLENTKKLFQA